jgi:ABC-type transport system involved in cytochrome c biogenesis permease subunit
MTKGSTAAGVSSLNAFARIVILDNGRLKPLDTYAGNVLVQFSGKTTFNHKPAIYWLAETLLSPQSAVTDDVLLINNPEIADALGIASKQHRRYNFSQIMSAMDKLSALAQASGSIPPQQRSPFDREIVGLTDNLALYVRLIDALRFAASVPQLAIDDTTANAGKIPSVEASTRLWVELATTYKAGDQDAFDEAARGLSVTIKASFPKSEKPKDPGLEILYNRSNPFGWSKILYGIGLLALVVYLTLRYRGFHVLSVGLISAGFITHTLGLACRMMILSRPPVTNIYETFVFVGWIAVVLGCTVELFQKQGWGLALAALSGFALLHGAAKFSLEGDTMGMLAAVLNSNFWLTTHVITIACGYAGCVAAGLLAHVSLARIFIKNAPSHGGISIDKSVYGILSFGFTCTVLGTVLGGLWADRAWGRFWGWDPKENGALLIILWCAFLFHARSASMIKERGFAVGAIIGLVLVMFAWIGVNLLGIGLHAYGFTSTGARLLVFVVGAEVLFLACVGVAYGIKSIRSGNNSGE